MKTENIKRALSDLLHNAVASGDLNREPRNVDQLVGSLAQTLAAAEDQADRHFADLQQANAIVDSLPGNQKQA